MIERYIFRTYEEAFESMLYRFWKKVKRGDDNECWLWMGSKVRNNYGQIELNFKGSRKTFLAHKLSYIIHKGNVPEGLEVCHNCPSGDNPACVNPAHLWLGTHKENMQDMVVKGRAASGARSSMYTHPEVVKRGTKNKLAALKSQEDIDKIVSLRKEKVKIKEIARIVGVRPEVVWKLLSGETYKEEMRKHLGSFKMTTKNRRIKNMQLPEMMYISKLLQAGVTQTNIAKMLRVSSGSISKLVNSEKFKSLELL